MIYSNVFAANCQLISVFYSSTGSSGDFDISLSTVGIKTDEKYLLRKHKAPEAKLAGALSDQFLRLLACL